MRFLVKVCTGGDLGEPGCGFVVKVKEQKGAAVGSPANDCPTCGAPRYFDRLTQREIDRANGEY